MIKILLRKLVPILHPRLWATINGLCLLWSLALLWLIIAYPDDPESYNFVRKYYYSYDLITCIIWVVEVSLDLIYFFGILGLHHDDSISERQSTVPTSREREMDALMIKDGERCSGVQRIRPHSLLIELVLASYFLTDSIEVSVLKLKEIKREDEHMTFDVMVNASAYLYITLRQFVELGARRNKRGTSSFDETVLVSDSDSSASYSFQGD